MALDPIDYQLLTALRTDASQPLERLAALVHLASSSVHERLRRLERDKVLLGWTVDVDYEMLGLGILAYVGVRASKSCSELLLPLQSIAAIEECHSVAGQLTLLLKVRVETTAALLILIERLRQIPGIDGTETIMVLKTQFQRPVSMPSDKSSKRTSKSKSRT
jgi:Lrp/AsnC family leucine-responsive transcriptional regulator